MQVAARLVIAQISAFRDSVLHDLAVEERREAHLSALHLALHHIRQALDYLQRAPTQACVFIQGEERLSADAAKAYDIVRRIRLSNEVATSQDCVDFGKDALLATREFLLITILSSAERAQEESAQMALERAFARNLGFEERMRMVMARSAMGRLGRSRSTFRRAAPKIWGAAVTQDEIDALFLAYAACATNIKQSRRPEQHELEAGVEQEPRERVMVQPATLPDTEDSDIVPVASGPQLIFGGHWSHHF